MRVILVCLISAVAAEESFSALGFAKIHEQLDALAFSGSGRMSGLAQGHKMLVEKFLKDAAASGKLSPANKLILKDQVLPLIENLITYMAAEKAEDDLALSAAFGHYSQCERRKESDIADKAAAQAALSTLVNCRHAEATKYGTDATTCGALDSFLGGVANGMITHCQYPSRNGQGTWGRTNIQPFGDKLTGGHAHVSNQQGQFTTKREACDDAATALHNQHVQCQSDDVELQNAWCTWSATRTAKCSEQAACHGAAKSHYDGVYNGMKPKADSRVKDAENMYFVRCLVTELSNPEQVDNFDEWISGCNANIATYAADYFQTTYGIAYNPEPAEMACDAAEPNPTPSNQAQWVADRYTANCGTGTPTHCNTVMATTSTACPTV